MLSKLIGHPDRRRCTRPCGFSGAYNLRERCGDEVMKAVVHLTLKRTVL